MLWSFFLLVPDEDMSLRAFRWLWRKYRVRVGVEKMIGRDKRARRILLDINHTILYTCSSTENTPVPRVEGLARKDTQVFPSTVI